MREPALQIENGNEGAGIPIAVRGQSVLYRIALETCLRAKGFLIAPHAAITVLLDTPMLSALLALESGLGGTVLIVTENKCCEYWLDLLAFTPAGLLVNPNTVEEIVSALTRATSGVRVHPEAISPLWPQERRVLRLLAASYEPEAIALRLGIKGPVVRNYVSSILMKLRLAHPDFEFQGRSQLVSYYWGMAIEVNQTVFKNKKWASELHNVNNSINDT